MRLHPTALAPLLVASAIVPGCSDGDEGVPVACRQGPDTVREALRAAPAPVRLDGTPLSDCIDDESGGGALQEVGESYVSVAAELAEAASRRPNGDAALRLGYLMGAFERSRAGAQGVGHELGRRLRAEVSRVDARSRAYRRGERAGHRDG